MIKASLVKELRERTGAGMMDCKAALVEKNGDLDKAADFLREKGLAAAAKKSSRIASEGLVEAYIHGNGRIGVLIEINCETDFVAKTPEFRDFVKDMAMQIAAANPKYVSIDEVPEEEIHKEKEILRAQVLNEGKPENVVDKIIEGKIKKYFKEICLLEQPYIRDNEKVIKDIVTDKIAKIGENINIRRFTRFEKGEGLQKRSDNLAEEVKKQLAK